MESWKPKIVRSRFPNRKIEENLEKMQHLILQNVVLSGVFELNIYKFSSVESSVSDHFALVRLFMTKPCLHALAPLQPCYKAYTRVAHASNNINAGASCECGWADTPTTHETYKICILSKFATVVIESWNLGLFGAAWREREAVGVGESKPGEFFARRRPIVDPCLPPPPASRLKSEDVFRLAALVVLLPLPSTSTHRMVCVRRSGSCAGPH
jgi:hypothetical protein